MKNYYQKLLYLPVFLFFFGETAAQPAAELFGGRTAGMGFVSTTIHDYWSAFHNPAGLNGVEQAGVALAYTNRYGVPAFQSVAAAGAFKLNKFALGAGISRFGDQLFNRQKILLTAASRLSGVDVALRLGYMQIATSGLETHGLPFLDLGVIAQLTKHLRIGASLHHINQPKVSSFEQERLPALVRAGFSYQPVSRFTLHLDTEKETGQDFDFRAGAEYQWHKAFSARTGISTRPAKAYFGTAVSLKNIGIDYALHTHPKLGMSHQVSLNLKIPQKSAKTKPTQSQAPNL